MAVSVIESNPDLVSLIFVGATAGMRRDEICGLRFFDVDPEASMLQGRHGGAALMCRAARERGAGADSSRGERVPGRVGDGENAADWTTATGRVALRMSRPSLHPASVAYSTPGAPTTSDSARPSVKFVVAARRDLTTSTRALGATFVQVPPSAGGDHNDGAASGLVTTLEEASFVGVLPYRQAGA